MTVRLIGFQKRFAVAVWSNQKHQTIRRKRKNPIVAGDRLRLYTGLRTKRCVFLKEVLCRSVESVVIGAWSVRVAGARLLNAEQFAAADGFGSYREMAAWFRDRYGLPFRGVLIRW